MSAQKAFVFDVFGTVVDWRTGIVRECKPFLAAHGGANDAERFADAWRGRYQPTMQTVRSGRRPYERLDVLHREMLDVTLLAFGIDHAKIPEADKADLALAWRRLDPWPDSLEGITRLRAGHVVAPLSNGNIALMVALAKHGGLVWDAILGAEVSQAYKPDPKVYLHAADILGLAPEEVCMVAAHNDDLVAARACGLKTAFVRRPTEHGSGQTLDLEPSEAWDWVAEDLVALAAMVGPQAR